ncbi:MAG: fused MFS/spermidine synthase [Synergistaceae bacterium]|nr:fused MFS/spermidine synthase [Synergistaceae bacterium]
MSYEKRKSDGGNVKIKFRLQLVSFFSGAATMILELAGSRMIAPFFGTSLIVWTALIGIIMTSLCLGNWLGGSVADKNPTGKLLGRILMFAAIIIAITAFMSNYVLTTLQSLSLNLYMSSVFSAFIIFAPSSVLLGMVSPFVARLAMQDVDSSGAVVGKLSALNSAGSILGTFMGGFVLISLFPSGVILMFVASVVALLSVLVYTGAWRKIISVVIFLSLFGGAYAAKTYGLPFSPVGTQIDTQYNHLSIVESIDRRNGRRVRILITDPDAAQSLMYTDHPSELVSEYTKFYDLAFHYKPDTKKILMLGGGGYCVPRHLLSQSRDISVDVVELDPGVTQAARDYFDLKDDPRLTIFHEDARTFLNRNAFDENETGKYDAIFMDTFTSATVIPFQLTTVETAERLRRLLKPDGVLIVNIIASVYGPKAGVFHGIYKAFSNSFSTMMIFPANAPDPKYALALQNVILVAMGDTVSTVSPNPDARFLKLLSNQWLEPFTPDPKVPAFTDSFAPVERYALVQQDTH